MCEQVGEGTFGVVSRMLDIATGLERAIKTVPKDLLDESDLWQEIEFMRDFDHPFVARLYGTYEDPANLYMIMEHCSGGELFEAVDHAGTLPETTSATIFQQMLMSVSYIHSKQICHRDLKPENFLLSRPGPVERALVKLIDFGTARHFSAENPMTTKICTIHYVAPEILVRGAAPYTEKCDTWSLGVCLYLMVCGSPPFYGDTDTVTLKQVRKGKFKFEPVDFWATMEEDIRLLISALLQMSPEDRLSAQEALRHPWFTKKARRTSITFRVEEVIPRLLRFRKYLWFKQKSMQLIANHLSEDDVNDIRPLWFQFDINNCGKITRHELARAIPAEGLSDELLEKRALLLQEMEADGKKGEVGYTAFLAAMLDADRRTNPATCKSAFREFDLDNDGFIRMTELSLIWQCDQLKTDTSDALGALAWRSIAPGREALSLDEFMAMMKEEEAP
jgi:calcium-dependent protein kinase